MSIIQTQGVHHITLNGADRKTSIGFWQDIMGMPFVAEQPNLDDFNINHLYFDCGDGRMLTIFTDESREMPSESMPQTIGSVHHLAFMVSMATIRVAQERLKQAGFANSGIKDRGFMDSLYFRDPMGLLLELACYKFEPPQGKTHGQVLAAAHRIRLARDANAIEERDVADALKEL